MILINLLPHREATRKRRKEAFQATMVLSALIGLLIIGAVYWWYQMMIEAQQAKNSMLRAEITVLESQIKEIAGLEDEITALRARQKAVEDLQSDRNLPVHMLNELVSQLPDGVYITSIKQEGLAVTMQGTAQSNERVSEMLRNLSEERPGSPSRNWWRSWPRRSTSRPRTSAVLQRSICASSSRAPALRRKAFRRRPTQESPSDGQEEKERHRLLRTAGEHPAPIPWS